MARSRATNAKDAETAKKKTSEVLKTSEVCFKTTRLRQHSLQINRSSRKRVSSSSLRSLRPLRLNAFTHRVIPNTSISPRSVSSIPARSGRGAYPSSLRALLLSPQ